MWRLFRGEVMKMLRLPMIYILVVVLSLIITFSFLFYQPQSKVCNTYVNDANMESSVEALYVNHYENETSKFYAEQVYNLINANISKNSVQDIINFYDSSISINDNEGNTIQQSIREKINNKLISIKEKYIKLYQDWQSIAGVSDASCDYLDSQSKVLYSELVSLKEFLNTESSNSTNMPTLSFLTTEKFYKSFIKDIQDKIDFLKNAVHIEGVNSITSTVTAYKVVAEEISEKYFEDFDSRQSTENNIFILQKDFQNNSYDLAISKTFLDELEKSYVTDATTKLDKRKNELEDFYNSLKKEDYNKIEQKELLLDKISLFYSTAYYANMLTKSLIVKQLSKDFTDKQFNEFIGVADLNTSLSMDAFNTYNFNQIISLYSYIYNNNIIEYNYGTAFSSNQTSNYSISKEKPNISAFDYSFYVLDIFSFIIIVFSVIVASGMIAGEQKDKTLKLLAIRPYSRNQILNSKIITTLFFAFLFVILSVLISLIAGYFMYGINFNDIIISINASTVLTLNPVLLYLIYIACLFIKILFYVLLAFAISTILKSYLAATVVNVFCLLIATLCNNLLSQFTLWKYIAFANLDLFKYFGNGTFSSNSSIFTANYIIPGTDLIFSLIITVVSIVLIALVTQLVFRKRDIA